MASEIMEYKAADGQMITLTHDFICDFVCKGKIKPTVQQSMEFMVKCQARGWDPLAGDCYMTIYKNRDGSTTMSVVVSKDYWVRTAHMQPTFRGMRAGIIVNNNGNVVPREGANAWPGEQLLGGWCEVKDARWDWPLHHEVSLAEYDQGTSVWADKPATMIRKVAVTQALREAYPNAFQGGYDESEMWYQVEDGEDTPVEVYAEAIDE